MKFSCFCLDLNNSISKVIKAIGAKTANPALEGIKITAKNGNIILKATNGKMTIENIIKANIFEEGEVLVPSKYFSEYIKKFSDGEVEIKSINDNEIYIKTFESNFKLKCLKLIDFPVIKNINDDISFVIKAENLKKSIENTIFATSIDDSRPILKGCLLDLEGEILTVVGLDGYRMAIYKTNIESKNCDIKVVIPSKQLSEISKLISNNDEIIKICVDEKYVMACFENTIIIVSIINGEYINYKSIIPNKFETEVVVDKKAFADGIDKASVITRIDGNNLVKFEISDKNLKMLSNSEIGDFQQDIVIGLVGKDINIGFNSKYFSDCLRQIDEEFIKINLNENKSPVIITPCDNDKFLFMILPVRNL